jgi:hypothetical protein
LVVEKIELLQLEELADRLWQRAQLVVGKIELLKLGELADRLWQRAQLVVGKIELLELGELADRLWQRAQVEIDQIQFPRTAFPGLLDAAQGFFHRWIARDFCGRPFLHTRCNLETTRSALLCRFLMPFL